MKYEEIKIKLLSEEISSACRTSWPPKHGHVVKRADNTLQVLWIVECNGQLGFLTAPADFVPDAPIPVIDDELHAAALAQGWKPTMYGESLSLSQEDKDADDWREAASDGEYLVEVSEIRFFARVTPRPE